MNIAIEEDERILFPGTVADSPHQDCLRGPLRLNSFWEISKVTSVLASSHSDSLSIQKAIVEGSTDADLEMNCRLHWAFE